MEKLNAQFEKTIPDQLCARLKALVICAHLRPSRTKKRSKQFMQPLSGLHIASIAQGAGCLVDLHHEDWHGPYDTSARPRYDLVFLTGLQADFDRMRQLSYFFRRDGAIVVAGGSICTLFPEFSAPFRPSSRIIAWAY